MCLWGERFQERLGFEVESVCAGWQCWGGWSDPKERVQQLRTVLVEALKIEVTRATELIEMFHSAVLVLQAESGKVVCAGKGTIGILDGPLVGCELLEML